MSADHWGAAATDRLPTVLRGCSVLPPMASPRMTADPLPKATGGPTDKRKGTGKGKPKGDRFPTLNRFIDFTLRDLDRNEIAVWLILFRDTRDGTARTAQSDIARRAGIVRRSVIRILGRLEAKGLLQTVHRGGLKKGMNVYRVVPLAKPLTKPPVV